MTSDGPVDDFEATEAERFCRVVLLRNYYAFALYRTVLYESSRRPEWRDQRHPMAL